MRKPDSLRQWLLRSVHQLRGQDERLHLWIEEGRIICVEGKSLSYQYRYDLILTLEDFGAEADKLIVPLLAWLSENQPELLRDQDSPGIPIIHDILSNKSTDIEIKLPLSEKVIVTHTPEGGWNIEYPPERTFPESFNVHESTRLLQLYLAQPPAEGVLVAASNSLQS